MKDEKDVLSGVLTCENKKDNVLDRGFFCQKSPTKSAQNP